MISDQMYLSPVKKTEFFQNPQKQNNPFFCFKNSLKFVNREDISEGIKDTFLRNYNKLPNNKRIVVLHQTYGIGKTSLAYHFQNVCKHNKAKQGEKKKLETDETIEKFEGSLENDILKAKIIPISLQGTSDEDIALHTVKEIVCLLNGNNQSEANNLMQQETSNMGKLNALADFATKKLRGILLLDEFAGSGENIDSKVDNMYHRIKEFVVPFLKSPTSNINCIITSKAIETFFLGQRIVLDEQHEQSPLLFEFMHLETISKENIQKIIENTQLTQEPSNFTTPTIYYSTKKNPDIQEYTLKHFFLSRTKLKIQGIVDIIHQKTKGIPRLIDQYFQDILTKNEQSYSQQLLDSIYLKTINLMGKNLVLSNAFSGENKILIMFFFYAGVMEIPLNLWSKWKLRVNNQDHDYPLSRILLTMNFPFSKFGDADTIKIVIPQGLQFSKLDNDSNTAELETFLLNTVQQSTTLNWKLFEEMGYLSFLLATLFQDFAKSQTFGDLFEGIFKNSEISDLKFGGLESVQLENGFRVKGEKTSFEGQTEKLVACAESFENLMKKYGLDEKTICVPEEKSAGYDFRLWGNLVMNGNSPALEKSHIILFQCKHYSETPSPKIIIRKIEKICNILEYSKDVDEDVEMTDANDENMGINNLKVTLIFLISSHEQPHIFERSISNDRSFSFEEGETKFEDETLETNIENTNDAIFVKSGSFFQIGDNENDAFSLPQNLGLIFVKFTGLKKMMGGNTLDALKEKPKAVTTLTSIMQKINYGPLRTEEASSSTESEEAKNQRFAKVKTWLQELKLERLYQTFFNNGYDWEAILLGLDEKDYSIMGIEPGDQKKFLKYFKDHPDLGK